MKVCCVCKEEKDLGCFSKDKTKRDGLQNKCKVCVKEYYSRNRAKIKSQARKYKEDNREKVLAAKKVYKRNNKDKEKVWAATSYSNIKNDPVKRLIKNARGRISKVLGSSKYKNSLEFLGCSTQQFKSHIESQFKPGMTWDNYGEWHVDHIIPLCTITNLDDKEYVESLLHYSNTQPMWAEDNISKGGRTCCKLPLSHPVLK